MPNCAVNPNQSAAHFAARLGLARSETPGNIRFKSESRYFGGTIGFCATRSTHSRPAQDAGLAIARYQYPAFHAGLFPNVHSICHPEALLLREGSPAICRTELPLTWPLQEELKLLGRKASRLHVSRKHRRRSIAQKKRFRMTGFTVLKFPLTASFTNKMDTALLLCSGNCG